MKPRYFFVLLTAVVVFLLAIAGWGTALMLGNSPLNLAQGGVSRGPMAPGLIPGQSPIMVSLLVNPDRLEAFTQLAVNPGRRGRSHRELAELEQSLLAKTGLDYRREVKPWLGEEVSLAVTDLDYDHDGSNGAQPGYLLIVHSQDPELSREFLQLSYATAAIAGDTDLVLDRYQGVKITYKRPVNPVPNGDLLASAVVGDYVLFANHPQVLRQALNSLQAPSLSLAQTETYQTALASLTAPKLGLVYANFPALAAWLGQRPALDKNSDQTAIEQTLTVALSLQAQGLVAHTALTGLSTNNPGEKAENVTAIKTNLVNLPPTSSLVINGQNLAQQWQQLADGLAPHSPLQQALSKLVGDWQQTIGLDLTTDIFPWVQGDYQLIFLPKVNPSQSDWVFAAQDLDATATDVALEYLDQLAIAAGYQLSALELQGQKVIAWTSLQTLAKENITSLQTQVRGIHCRVGDRVILASSLEALSQVLDKTGPSLAEQTEFQQALSTLPGNSYVYLDWQRGEQFFSQQLPILRVLELSLKPLFKNLRSLTINQDPTSTSISNSTIYLNLGVD
ncbi:MULTISPECIES: DUF3352 domain-containing protein [unclassified Synechocystis]|uniref:DUF3352 domain-containing protein n=1 Tax=unclassified Synechocystis TaxID=2640012 RepID=UPI000425356D|nr:MULTISPECIES: DUF3352 domain-containing protein [unclassified Synechocystis]AIE73204.1 hypothetical protein D082_06750 [Synechocystis sp. PCC 6714]MCT0254281.1 DUF3352 domain-containing protein [Synechocystis sp. CS-94]